MSKGPCPLYWESTVPEGVLWSPDLCPITGSLALSHAHTYTIGFLFSCACVVYIYAYLHINVHECLFIWRPETDVRTHPQLLSDLSQESLNGKQS